MTHSDFAATADIHPIDVAENVASHHEWDFDRVAEDQIALEIEGMWRTYSLTIAWSAADETLRLLLTFECEPPEGREGALYELLNGINDRLWSGAVAWWGAERLLTYRYGLMLGGEQVAVPEQIDQMIQAAVGAAERYWPALQLVLHGGVAPRAALQAAIAEAYGRA